MEKMRPLLLISNDDGYLAGGINQLVAILRPLADIVVVAPDVGRSGAGMAMTVTSPVSVRKICEEEGLTIYACTGTPVDCVKLAAESFVPRCPDMVVAGINHGENAGINVHYSGTMGVVMEGCLKGIPSVGFSAWDTDKQADFSPFASVIVDICRKILKRGLPRGTCLNVNFPAGGTYKGVRVCRQDEGQWLGEWECTTRKTGERHFWLSGEYQSLVPDDETTDRWALTHGFIAVTPTTIDLTDHKNFQTIQELFVV